MRVLTAQAILLQVSDLSDGDRVVSFLTPEFGLKRGAARGAKRKYSRFAGQLQPLATVQVTWFEKDDRDLVRIRDLEIEASADHLRRSLEDLLIGSYLSEHVLTFAQENDAAPELYRLLRASVDWLGASGRSDLEREALLRYFEIWSLRIAGVLPQELACPLCGEMLVERAVLPDLGETLVCTNCAREEEGGEGMLVGSGSLRLMARSRRSSPGEFSAAIAAGGARDGDLVQLEEVLLRIRRRFLGFELKSHGVIRETLRQVRLAEKGA